MSHNETDLAPCVLELLDNDHDIYEKAKKTLLEIMDNIEHNQGVEKYRKIKLASVAVSNNLLPASGGLECLWAAGFVEDSSGEYLVLPANASLDSLRKICLQIRANGKPQPEKPHDEAAKTSSCLKGQAAAQKWTMWTFPTLPSNIRELELRIFAKLKASFDHVLIYEKPSLQQKAKQLIPIERLSQNAKRKFHDAKGSSFQLEDFYIIELMDWFREEFFRWVNSPDCGNCGGKTERIGMGRPTDDDLRWDAARVELHRCALCSHTTRFPRYNHPEKLLETRRGRCGEWANCFTLICRASGYEARHVHDWTDHVWTEVFSQSQQRWLHCDPGEKALDKPLLYEAGWGKKLTYIIACSKDDINDVTWRYSADHQALVLRRKECRESWLLATIKALRDARQRNMSDVVRRIHQLRLIKEGVEFISSERKPHSAGEMIGRLTGSKEWREGRGEMGAVAAAPHHEFIPSDGDMKQGFMEVGYCCATDCYATCNSKESLHGWKSGVYECCNIDRTVEIDWNMAYLARTKGSPNASIIWKFDLSSSGKEVHTVSITVHSATFHSGCVKWSLEDNKGRTSSINYTKLILDAFKGATSLKLSAELSSGEGENAWQHTQLFRQKRESQQQMLSIKIQFL
ncbi:peptide-N(4)-(N-acetyl-beta-glucosaminyl)asparagine amidase-like isoform X2 [Watersipora subatra]|uniref:peptide-N(4)-(N-acetyl-beta- glucosaminyl)asparagine amidase-like isoform X2 n=1 Tax=Watersipora subatra TaxID=2589382 RepID=UPI00355B6261